jgi:hypothetical protein
MMPLSEAAFHIGFPMVLLAVMTWLNMQASNEYVEYHPVIVILIRVLFFVFFGATILMAFAVIPQVKF